MLSRLAATLLLLAPVTAFAAEPAPPEVGRAPTDFALSSPDGHEVTLSKLAAKGPVVVTVLRGWPGYQCPICRRQVGQFLKEQQALADAGAQVLMIYPGPADDLAGHAREFFGDVELPPHFTVLIDPDYTFTNAWHLRWDAPRETAYPSTFVVGKDGKITYAKVSQEHGGRANIGDVLKSLK